MRRASECHDISVAAMMFAANMFAAMMFAATVLACGGTTTPPAMSQWTPVWSDDFDGPAGARPDSAKWLFDLGTRYGADTPDHWGTGEIETMTADTANVALDGHGHLLIRPIRAASGAWTSARIETQRNDFEPPAHGVLAIEASIQQPTVTPANGLGYWPAFWMLGGPFRAAHAGWPAVGEIDILENVNGRSSLWTTFHCGETIPGPCHETTGLGSGERPCPGCLTSFHIYRVEWDRSVSPQELRWYLDSANVFTLRQDQVDAAAWTAATSHGYMIILDVAIGGGFPAAFGGGPTVATVSGAPMIVDYVHVLQRSPE
jgi:beta-glucanase (GH16 family)